MLFAEHSLEPQDRPPSATTIPAAADPRYQSVADRLTARRPLSDWLRAIDAAIEEATAPLLVGIPRGGNR